MECTSCKQKIEPGLQIMVDELSTDRAHCPYCLAILSSSNDLPAEADAKRVERRKTTRVEFIERMTADGKELHCPSCDHILNSTDRKLLLDKEHFLCHLCHTDLATVAYQQEAYHEQRWLPVVFAMGDLCSDPKCTDCCYLAAIAKSCWTAFSRMPNVETKPARQAMSIFRPSSWNNPSCDWQSCFAVQQYRKLAGDGLRIV